MSLSNVLTGASANSILGVYDGPTEPVSVVLTPDNSELWVPSYQDVQIKVYDASTMSHLRTINSTALSGHRPITVTFSPDGSIAYVTSEEQLIFLNSETGVQIAPVLHLESGSSVQNLVVSQNGQKLYMPSSYLNKIIVLDVTNLQNIPTPTAINTDINPSFISISTSKGLGVVSGVNGMQFFSLVTNQVLPAPALIVNGVYPSNPAFTSDGNFVYITWGGNLLRKIDSALRVEVLSEALPSNCNGKCQGVSVTPNGEQVWTSNFLTSGFNVFSSTSLQEISELQPSPSLVSGGANLPSMNSSGSKIYSAAYNANKVVVAEINPSQGIVPLPTPTPTPTNSSSESELVKTGLSTDALVLSILLLMTGLGSITFGKLRKLRPKKR